MADLTFVFDGSISFLTPMTPVGREWVSDNLNIESWQMWGGSVAIEPRMLEAIIDGAINDGLEVEEE